MTDRWVTLHNAESPVEAQAFLDFLHAHGVEARAVPHPDPHLAAAPVSPGWGVIQVPVAARDSGAELLRQWEEEPPSPIIEARVLPPPAGAPGQWQEPAWARGASGSWLWWALLLSVLANVVLAGLWLEAEQRAISRQMVPLSR